MGTLVNATRFPVLKALNKSFRELKASWLMNIKWMQMDDKKVMNNWVSDVLGAYKDEYIKNIVFTSDEIREFIDAHDARADHKEILKFKMGEVDTAGVLVVGNGLFLRYSLQIEDKARESDGYYLSMVVTFFKEDIPFMLGVRRFFADEGSKAGYVSLDNVTAYSPTVGDRFLDIIKARDSGCDGNKLLDAHNHDDLVGFTNTILALYMSLREHRAECVTVPNKTKSASNGTPYDNFLGRDFTYIKNIREREEGEEFDYEIREETEEVEMKESEKQEPGGVNHDPQSMFKVFVPVDKVLGPDIKEISGDNPLGLVFTEITPKMGLYQKFKERFPAASYIGVITIPVRWQQEMLFVNVYAVCNNGVTVFLSNSKKALSLFE